MQRDTPRSDRDTSDAVHDGGTRVAGLIERIDAVLRGAESATPELLRELRAGLQALHEDVDATHRRYDSLFNAVPDPISVLDAHGRVLELNDAGVRAYRRPRHEIVGRLVHVINPDLPADHMAPVMEALGRGETFVVEVENMRSDGSRFPVEVHSAGFQDGPHHNVIAVARDLSHRREAEMNYHALLVAIDKGVLFQGPDGAVRSANAAAFRILGLDEAQDIGEALRWQDWLVIDHRGWPIAFRDMPPMRALASGRIVESTLLGLHHRQKQQLSWISATSVPQFKPGSATPHQVVTLFSDVTELKRDSALFLRAQALARVGGWEWDGGRGRLYFTDEALRILGRRDDPPRGLPDLLGQIDAAWRTPVADAVQSLVRDGGGFDLEVPLQRPDGESHWVRLIGQSEGRAPMSTRINGTLQDVTQRRQIEEALRSQARTDALTGLLNRDGVLTELERRIGSGHAGTTVAYIDLDRFKLVNDLLGHSAGDHLLVNVARRLERAIGDDGLLARFGGDEFLVLAELGDDPGAAEALIRWSSPVLGELRPDLFIGHAETTGDIVRIGAWVIQAACRQMAIWREAGLRLERIAVNVSYRQFLTEDLPQIIRDALREHALPGSALELEFTERVLIEDAPDTHRTFETLRGLGVVLTIDDFGEGYSALNYLRRLPIHGLKLAQGFLQGVPANPSDVAICQAVAGMARGLGLEVVAEGVETPAQREFLTGLGIGVGQGFLFSPALDAEAFGEYARRAGLRDAVSLPA